MSRLSAQDWGSTPATIDNCLTVADELDVQVNIHTDTCVFRSSFSLHLPFLASSGASSELTSGRTSENRLNEAGFVEDTTAATKGRTISYYHVEGAGGGVRPPFLLCRPFPCASNREKRRLTRWRERSTPLTSSTSFPSQTQSRRQRTRRGRMRLTRSMSILTCAHFPFFSSCALLPRKSR